MVRFVQAQFLPRLKSRVSLRGFYENAGENVVILKRPNRRRRIVFGWYGGKFNHLDWLLPLLPRAHHYCEPFAGSAAVLLNRDPSPVETYNDIDGDVVNFFRVLRDRHDDLIRAIALTPFSREEFHRAINGSTQGISELERARRFYIRARQARTGLAQTATLGRWANCKNTSRAGMSGVVSRWLGGVEALQDIAERLLRVQIENRPALDIIHLYDSADTLFYCDPPYLHETRGDSKAYGFEMDLDQHRELARALNRCQGKVALSGYRCDFMDTWYTRMPVDELLICHPSITKKRKRYFRNYFQRQRTPFKRISNRPSNNPYKTPLTAFLLPLRSHTGRFC